MTRSDVVRRVIGVALLCLSGSAVWARLLRLAGDPDQDPAAGSPGVPGLRSWNHRGRPGLPRPWRTAGGFRDHRGLDAGRRLTLPDTQGREPLQVYTDSLVQWLGTLLARPCQPSSHRTRSRRR